MNGNDKPVLSDPDIQDWDGNFVGVGDYTKPTICPYNIRAFSVFQQQTGRSWDSLSAVERKLFEF